jgi:SagB-type dehydrogenase family enzyme
VAATPAILAVLDLFGRPRAPGDVEKALSGRETGDVVRQTIRLLRRHRLLLPESGGLRRRSRLAAWKGNVASAFYHVASRDLPFLTDWNEKLAFFRGTLLTHRRPRKFKRYDTAVRRPLATRRRRDEPTADFGDVLQRRRTVRQFSRRPVPFEDLAAVIGGTWGRTGWFDTGEFGLYASKTSPSAGALHPIECYVLAWNVRGLSPGLYHYDVEADELRRLRRGNFRSAAVKAASGQSWVGGAGFLCVLTAVFERSLWKYELENAYRDVWLDAGHLAQTFCLLATSRGLGPFTTVALQDSHIERLLGLDGIREFPVYLCGAGVPAKTRWLLPREP